ncbi:MAG: ribonuclease H-like domain-containing protein [Candidatus Thiodiazotropha sp.]
MNLKSRLSRLQSQSGSMSPAIAAKNTGLRDRLENLHRHRPVSSSPKSLLAAETDLAKTLNGRLVSEGLIRIRNRIPVPVIMQHYGLETLDLNPRLPGEPGTGDRCNRYLDTETTGLSGGSGTLSFLVGCAWTEETQIVLEQWLITRFSGEPGLLSALSQCLDPEMDRLVSYNGKSFDLPLLRSRFRMHALPWTLDAIPHLDLLHPVRRLFARHWPDCRLLTLEKRLLNFHRRGDLPGAEAPDAWFDFIRQLSQDRLVRTVRHHRDDILSLIVAHSRLAQTVIDAPSGEIDVLGIARWLMAEDPRKACQVLQRSYVSLDEAGKLLLARLLKRNGEHQQARKIWESLAEENCTEALERLAKYHEHVTKAVNQAHTYCLKLPEGVAKRKRIARLEMKMQSGSYDLLTDRI